ncbi:MAG: hypothetical protein V4760_04000 [Bdellovibrionota bacterium]
MTKALLIAAALIAPMASQAAGLHCKAARLGLELAVPLQNAALTGSVKLTKVQGTLLEVKPDRVRDLVVTPTSVSFTGLAADSEETILKFEATKNEYGRYVGYILYAHSQIGFVCTEN